MCTWAFAELAQCPIHRDTLEGLTLTMGSDMCEFQRHLQSVHMVSASLEAARFPAQTKMTRSTSAARVNRHLVAWPENLVLAVHSTLLWASNCGNSLLAAVGTVLKCAG